MTAYHHYLQKTGLMLVSLSVVSLLLAAPAQAQLVRNMTVIPPSADYTVNPGDKIEGTLKMINDGDQPVTFRVDTRDYIVQDTHGTPAILPPNTLNNRFSAANWIGVVPNSFTVLPRQKQELNFYLQIPADAAPGGHYMAVVYTPIDNATSAGNSGATIQTQLGTIFRITVRGTINEYAFVSKIMAPFFQENGPVAVAASIQNGGDLHIKPTGTIVVTDMFGRAVEEQQLPSENIFPTTTRDYALKVGSYWMFGRYQVRILAQYGVNGNLPLTATVAFWVFPWRLAVLVTLILVAVILGIILFLRRKKGPPMMPESM